MTASAETSTTETKAPEKPAARSRSRTAQASAPRTRVLAEIPATNGETPKYTLAEPDIYLNRELTWLSFNQRVLNEARDTRTPLLERLKFAAIVSANLDEFFMKRIGGLKQQAGAGIKALTVDGRTPQQQIDECYAMVREIEEDKRTLLLELIHLLTEKDIQLIDFKDLNKTEQKKLREYYYENIFPLLTPQGMDPAHPFPFISNLSMNLLVTLQNPATQALYMARVKVPVGAGVKRFLKIGEGHRYLPIEQIISNNLDMLFPEMTVLACEVFRVTRNANTERAEDKADDLLVMIESELRERRFAPIVRLEIQQGMSPVHRGMLAAELGLDEHADVFEVEGMMGMRDLFEVVGIEGADLHDPPFQAIDHPKLVDAPSIFHVIRQQGAILVHHPYESFSSSVERFLKDASEDPKVRAVKMTLYRTSSTTKVIDYLVQAARNGKQVAVVVELKARFDEAANIRWATRMEEAGIHVTYGVVGLKTHSKVILVVRQDYSYNKIQRYAHIGTGNYHAGTARLYSDLGLLTCDDDIGEDLTELFNFLTTGFTPNRYYQKILPSPKILKKALIDKIHREIKLHSDKTPGLIQFKMNALEDADVTQALYEASRAGVKVDLIVRDTCRFRPGLAGLSENARVISIVGRFLEHTRIYYFQNSGDEEYFIGSADTMKRNLESRVEVVTPVEDAELRNELRMILDTQLNDQRSAWDMQADGSYIQRQPKSEKDAHGAQDSFIATYEDRHRHATLSLRKRKKGGRARRNV
jgi:polyphosphate kinase